MSWGLCAGVLGRFFFVVYSLVCGSGIPFVGCDFMTVDVVDSCMHLKFLQHEIPQAATTV